MTDRTFQQYAQAYGSGECQVACQIDGNTVFSGAVTTLDQPWPSLPDPDFKEPALGWTWQDSVDFTGTREITISVTGADLLLAQTFANDPYANVGPGNVPGSIYGPFYSKEIANVAYYDPFTNEAIDDVPQSGPYQEATPGQWWWKIPAGSTFSATMHIIAGSPEPDPPA